LKLLEARFVVDEWSLWCRDTDVPIRVGLFDVSKAGKVMTKRKFGTFLGRRRWLTEIFCAEKTGPAIHRKANCVRLFKG
jgi:hypothetical protein